MNHTKCPECGMLSVMGGQPHLIGCSKPTPIPDTEEISMTEKTYKYPDWIRPTKFSQLEPGIREYWLRRVGYDTVNEDTHPGMKDGDMLPDDDKAEAAIREWMYGKALESHIWCAKGFHQARWVDTDSDGNLAMSNDFPFIKMIHWLATMQWEESIDHNWLNDPYDEEEFAEHNEWADML